MLIKKYLLEQSSLQGRLSTCSIASVALFWPIVMLLYVLAQECSLNSHVAVSSAGFSQLNN